MGVLSAQSIRERCFLRFVALPRPKEWEPLLHPFNERTLDKDSGTTFGLGPCTYDVRVGESVRLERNGGFKRGVTLERFAMPRDLCATVLDKSTWARKGLHVFNTHIDPGWQGWLTLEMVNYGPDPLFFAAGTPIAQIEFKLLDQPTEQPYAGKYQNQENRPVPAIHEGS